MSDFPATVYVAMVADRHCDPEPYVFTTEAAAVAFARKWARDHARTPDDVEENQTPDGWLYYADHSTEGDCVWVTSKEIQT